MLDISFFLSKMDALMHKGKEYYSVIDVASRVNGIESGLKVDGAGLLITPYIHEDWFIPWFPYGFYAEKVDSSQDIPGELMLSSGFADLARTDYCALSSEEPFIPVARLRRYLAALEGRYRFSTERNAESFWNDVFFRFTLFSE